MPNTTINFGLKKPLANEHYDIAVQNENMDAIDAALVEKLDKTGAGSDLTVAFTQASTRDNVASGEKLSVLFGKLRKWFADLKTVAWSGSYNDLTDKPTIPTALAELNEDSTHRTVTDTEKAAWNAKSNLALGETAATAYRGDRGKVAYDHSQQTGNPHGTTPSDIGAAEATHTHGNLSVNGKTLTGAVTLSATDVGAVPTTRTVNGKALSANIALTASDVGAASTTSGTATITTSWSGPNAQGYYTRAVTISGLQSADNVDVTCVLNVSDKAASDLIQEAWGLVATCVVSANTLTFYATKQPSVAIPIAWKVVR